MTLKEKLTEMNACQPAIKWVGDMDFAEAWATCERGDWMLWIMQVANLCDLRTFTLAKARCAETVKHLMKDPRSIAALQAAFDFAEGKITDEELEEAAAAARAAWAAAARAAAWAAAEEAAAAWAAAEGAAEAAAWAAEAAEGAPEGAAAAREKHLKLCADLVREVLPNPIFNHQNF